VTGASSVQTENLAAKRALVTGGTRGTGAAVAARLKDAGAHVAAIGRHPVEHVAADEFVLADITTVKGTDRSGKASSPAVSPCPPATWLGWGPGHSTRRGRGAVGWRAPVSPMPFGCAAPNRSGSSSRATRWRARYSRVAIVASGAPKARAASR
jgi:NAD(P)-dependent dehydrogenase (short-subunit alcohol dehydrogenase family)